MTDTTTQLIQRLKDATEGSRELDVKIATAVGWAYNRDVEYCWTPPKQGALKQSYQSVPMFSLSIDAAMTLIDFDDQAPTILLDAINDNCETDWRKALPRYICIASLSARNPT